MSWMTTATRSSHSHVRIDTSGLSDHLLSSLHLKSEARKPNMWARIGSELERDVPD